MPILELQDWQGIGPANRVLKVVTLGDRRPDSMIPACSIHLITGAVNQLDLKVSRAVPWIILLAMSRTCCLKMGPGIRYTTHMLQMAISDETSKLCKLDQLVLQRCAKPSSTISCSAEPEVRSSVPGNGESMMQSKNSSDRAGTAVT